MSHDRNLLFGILALQMDFIDRDQLVSAMNAWVLDKQKLLADVLQEQQALADDERQLLDALVDKHLAKHGGDAEKSLRSLSSLGSAREVIEQSISDAAVQATLSIVSADRSDASDPYATESFSVGESSSAGTRFKVLRPHAKGGLGQVAVALDEELSREVALKQIQDQYADDLNSRARFVQEAEITGGLEHPGIVPVYGLGQYADGRPFYAMRFIRGDSLKDAIERFHDPQTKQSQDASTRSLELRKLLGRLIDVCNAIGYAHSRGVLHRDLKPGNVMLGKYGETLVVDWGLAKAVGRDEVQRSESEEPTLTPSSSSGSAPTQMGSAIGTPAYMSPEQAAGRLDQLGPASDVYSLGATLYTLLTGQAPFEGNDYGEVLRKVQQGQFPKPRQIDAKIPAALEAICLKAMATEPEHRYVTTESMAEDLEAWLADEPIAAHRESFTQWFGRWARRHRSYVQAAAAALVLVTVVSLAAMFLVNASRKAALLARDREATQRQIATKNAELARHSEEMALDAKLVAERQREDALAARAAETEQRQLAETSQKREKLARQEAEANGELLQHNLHASRMQLAKQAWQVGDVSRLNSLLESQIPRQKSSDIRGWEWFYLKGLPRQAILQLEGQVSAWSPDGKMLAILTPDGAIALRDAESGEVLDRFELSKLNRGKQRIDGSLNLKKGQATAIAWHPAGDRLVYVWNFRKSAVNRNNILTQSDASAPKVDVVDVETGSLVTSFTGHKKSIMQVAWSPDGGKIATAGIDDTIHVWDAEDSAKLAEIDTNSAGSFSWNPDGTQILVMAIDSYPQVFDSESGERVLRLRGHSIVTVGDWSKDGRKLATGSIDGSVKLWKAEDGEYIRELHYDSLIRGVAFNTDGSYLAVAHDDNMVRIWQTRDGKLVNELRAVTSGLQPLDWRSNTKTIATSSHEEGLQVWDALSTAGQHTFSSHILGVFALAWHPDSTKLLISGGGMNPLLRDVRSGRVIETFEGRPDSKRLQELFDEGSAEAMHFGALIASGLAWSPTGLRVAGLCADGWIRIWDGDGKLLHKFDGGPGDKKCIAWSPDGNRIVTGHNDSVVRIRDTNTGALDCELKGHTAGIWSVAWHPEKALLATCDSVSAYLWNPEDGKRIARLAFISPQALDWSPDGDRLAVGNSRALRMFDRNGISIPAPGDDSSWHRHSSPLAAIAWHPDGQRVATAAMNANTVHIWDAKTGEETISLEMREVFQITALAWSPNGRMLACSGAAALNGFVKVWDATKGFEQQP